MDLFAKLGISTLVTLATALPSVAAAAEPARPVVEDKAASGGDPRRSITMMLAGALLGGIGASVAVGGMVWGAAGPRTKEGDISIREETMTQGYFVMMPIGATLLMAGLPLWLVGRADKRSTRTPALAVGATLAPLGVALAAASVPLFVRGEIESTCVPSGLCKTERSLSKLGVGALASGVTAVVVGVALGISGGTSPSAEGNLGAAFAPTVSINASGVDLRWTF